MIASVHLADVRTGALLSLLRKAPDPSSVPGLRSARVGLAAPMRTRAKRGAASAAGRAPSPGALLHLMADKSLASLFGEGHDLVVPASGTAGSNGSAMFPVADAKTLAGPTAVPHVAYLADPEDSILQFYRTLGLQLEGSAALAGMRTSERRAERGQALQTISYPDVLRDKVIAGTPDAVAKRLAELTHTLGLSGVLAEINCGGRISTDKVMRSLHLMSEQVVPHFR